MCGCWGCCDSLGCSRRCLNAGGAALGSSGCHSHSIPCRSLKAILQNIRNGFSWQSPSFCCRQVCPWVNPWKSSSATLSFARGHQLLKLDAGIAGIQVCNYPTPHFGFCGSELFVYPCLKVILILILLGAPLSLVLLFPPLLLAKVTWGD